MNNLKINNKFWEDLDFLISTSEIIIDRPKGSNHPLYPNLKYPLNYGFIKNTRSQDNSEIDIYVGESPIKKITAIMCTIDLFKRDSEIKILFSCTEEEMEIIYKLNNEKMMDGILIKRDYY
jgi:inorganic pyrophosphatase